jgi:hypothetical protein
MPSITVGKEYSGNIDLYDLSRLARRLFALDTADDIHLLIDVGQGRPASLPELTRYCSAG